MAIVSKGQYSNPAPALSINGEYEHLQLDSSGNLLVHSTSSGVLALPDPLVGATATYGKITTVANTAALYIVCDCSDIPVSYVDWVVASDKQFNYQFFRAIEHPLAYTLTLTDATPVDDTDTFVLNGLTFTAESTEEDASAAARKYWTGASNAAAAVNLTALLNDATYGVPGFTFAVAAVTTTDVITATPTTATTVQFGQGASDANEVAFAETTLTNLYYQAAEVADVAATSTTMAGASYKQTLDGWPYAVFKLQNDSGAAAATFVVSALKY